MRRALERYGLSVTVETGARYVLDPRRKHHPTLLDPDPDARAKRLDLLLKAVRVAADLGAHAAHFFSGVLPAGTDAHTAWPRLADGVELAAGRLRRPPACRSPSSPNPGISWTTWPPSTGCAPRSAIPDCSG